MNHYKTMNLHIDEAITTFRGNSGRYAKQERYYDGKHDLAFATQKFQTAFGTLFREFALNLCPVVCDAMRDKLKITGFSVEDSGGNDTEHVAETARRIWSANRMALRSGEVHKEALKTGDAYVIVWPDTAGNAAIYPNRAAACTVVYSEEEPGRIERAAKYWRTRDGRVRLNLFYPDRIEKYISDGRSEAGLPDAKAFSLYRENADEGVIANPFGVVPVFHFANNSETGAFGRSEMEAAIPVQDGLNKTVLDMLVAMEYSAFRQRWVAGIELEIDEATGKPLEPYVAGIEQLWVASDPKARFGDFDPSDLEQFLKVKDGFRMDIASVTGTPLHYLMQTTKGVPSGESIRKAETRFLAKVRDRQESFGQVWADVMSLACAAGGNGAGVRFATNWEDPAPVSERELLENILMKKEIGIPVEQALREAGYGDDDVRQMTRRRNDGKSKSNREPAGRSE